MSIPTKFGYQFLGKPPESFRALTDGACTGYFYYGIKPFDFGGCEVAGEGFHE